MTDLVKTVNQMSDYNICAFEVNQMF